MFNFSKRNLYRGFRLSYAFSLVVFHSYALLVFVISVDPTSPYFPATVVMSPNLHFIYTNLLPVPYHNIELCFTFDFWSLRSQLWVLVTGLTASG